MPDTAGMGSSMSSTALAKSVVRRRTMSTRRVAGSGGSGARSGGASARSLRLAALTLRADQCQVRCWPGTHTSAWPGCPPSTSASTPSTTCDSFASPAPRVASRTKAAPSGCAAITSPIPVFCVYVGASAQHTTPDDASSAGAAERVNMSTAALVAAYTGA